ncbi:MAG: DNA cytosine methyltransferase [Nitrospinales bacterium]
MIDLPKRKIPFEIRYIDLFCGIGGFRIGAANVFNKYGIPSQCAFSCDIDEFARASYAANFGDLPHGDIAKTEPSSIPDHDLLFAGFPCQPFSIIGNGKGFKDTRGTLFFEIAKILAVKKPRAFVLENVKRLVGYNGGRALDRILTILSELGYSVDYKVLNALDFGLPQKRERVFFVGFNKPENFHWPQGGEQRKPLGSILEEKVDNKVLASATIRAKRRKQHRPKHYPSIWHENKSGHISSYPYSCALRAGASHNYLLVNGERRLTPREMLRLQGFPDSFKIVCSDVQTKKQAGNAVPVPVAQAIMEKVLPTLIRGMNENAFAGGVNPKRALARS